MTCKINITAAAERDVENAASYILYSLKNPVAAASLLTETDAVIDSLIHMPERYQLVNDLVLASWGIRYVRVKNYLAFYKVSSKTATVHIVRFLYGRSDWVPILRSSYIPEA